MTDSFLLRVGQSFPLRPLIVGREREQTILRQTVEQMLTGRGPLVLVSGQAGIGKTMLVDWLADEAQRCLVLSGRRYDLPTTPPYGPWREFRRSRTSSGDHFPMPSFDANPIAADALVNQKEHVD